MLSHVRPDGDALGSQIAMGLSLQKLGKSVKVWNEEGLLEKFSFLPGGELVCDTACNAKDFDVAIALDTATKTGLAQRSAPSVRRKSGSTSTIIRAIRATATWCIIDPIAPATGQILFETAQEPEPAARPRNRGKSFRRDLD